MKNYDEIYENIKNSISELIIPLQTTKDIKIDKFQKLIDQTISFSKMVKDEFFLPKNVMSELMITRQILEREIPYIKNCPQDFIECYKKFYMIIDLIFRSEIYEERYKRLNEELERMRNS